MVPTDTADTIEQFVRERFSVAADDPDFGPSVHLFDYGYVDSFGAVELTSFLEETFAIRIAATDFLEHPLDTVEEIAVFVERRRAGEI